MPSDFHELVMGVFTLRSSFCRHLEVILGMSRWKQTRNISYIFKKVIVKISTQPKNKTIFLQNLVYKFTPIHTPAVSKSIFSSTFTKCKLGMFCYNLESMSNNNKMEKWPEGTSCRYNHISAGVQVLLPLLFTLLSAHLQGLTLSLVWNKYSLSFNWMDEWVND